MALTAEEMDINVCVTGSSATIIIEGGERELMVPWNGDGFSAVDVEGFNPGGGGGPGKFFPDMTISGQLLNETSLEITVTVEGSGTTKFTTPFVSAACDS